MSEWAKPDANNTEPDPDAYVRALKEELGAYVAAGNDARAADVRKELERVGAGEKPARARREVVETEVASAPERATKTRAKSPRPSRAKAKE